MTVLFRRVVSVELFDLTSIRRDHLIDGLNLSNLDCTFQAKKSLKPEPNTCELKIFNLSASSRSRLETPKRLLLRLSAGYAGAIVQIFEGEVRSAHTEVEGPDIVTSVSTGDGEEGIRTARVNMACAGGTPIETVFNACVQQLGVGRGNLDVALSRLRQKGVFALRGEGTAFSGWSAEILTALCRSFDLEWSIQDGVMQFLERGKPLREQAVLLGPSTGLIGTPTVDHKGIVKASCLIQTNIAPGQKVAFDSTTLKPSQGFRVEECQYSGDTSGAEWTIQMTGKRY